LSYERFFHTFDTPEEPAKHLIVAFRGWPDANEAATESISYLIDQLSTKKVADLDPEDFFDFSHYRPITALVNNEPRLCWPRNEFFLKKSDDISPALLLLLGTEPNLKWRAFTEAIVWMAKKYNVGSIIHLGSLMDAVPHTRPLRFTGITTDKNLMTEFSNLNIHSSNYRGPTGIPAVLREMVSKHNLQYTSFWAHSPHYLQVPPNYFITYGLVKTLSQILNLNLSLENLKTASLNFEIMIQKAVETDKQLVSLVKRLEDNYDIPGNLDTEMPKGSDVVKDLELFLKDLRDKGDD
jgi:proteasome assembly chaperone (PAC2) family protein